ESCIEAAKPMRTRVDRRRENYPLRPAIARQKINCRIVPRDPRQDRDCGAGTRSHSKRSMPWLEDEHCDLTCSTILALRSRGEIWTDAWRLRSKKAANQQLAECLIVCSLWSTCVTRRYEIDAGNYAGSS